MLHVVQRAELFGYIIVTDHIVRSQIEPLA